MLNHIQYLSCWALALTFLCISASPLNSRPYDTPVDNVSISGLHGHDISVAKRDIFGGMLLRMMTLGASISAGALSTDLNGYRNHLRVALILQGNRVNYVGSHEIGTMADNQVEAWGGYQIHQMIGVADVTLRTQFPNVVLILVGTNDINLGVASMAGQMAGLFDQIWDRVPTTSIVVSTLPPNRDPEFDAKEVQYHADLKVLVDGLRAQNKRIILVNSYGFLTLDDITAGDNTHPNDGGYLKMARVFYDGIMALDDIQPAAESEDAFDGRDAPIGDDGNIYFPDPDGPIVDTCEMGPKTSIIGPVTRTQLTGSGGNDGAYVQDQNAAVVIDLATLGGGSSATIHWADLNGDGLDDYVHINKDFDSITYAFSLGAGKFSAAKTLATTDLGCDSLDGITFGDLGADGRDDVCCITSNGAVSCWVNSGTGDTVAFTSVGFIIGAQAGFPRDRVRLADIDGDGRMDFLAIQDSGNIIALRNGGVGIKPQYWSSIGTVFKGTWAEFDGVRFVDLNGDGRADLLYVNNGGQVTTWINNRGVTNGLAPHWVPAGTTHSGVVGSNARHNVTFGKIFGTTGSDKIWGAIKSDFVFSYDNTTGTGRMKIWENTGKGGTRLNGDGTRFCDMTGDGYDDYIWISPDGWMDIAVNIHNPPYWKRYLSQFSPKGVPRKEIHLADLDGDGKCDVLFVTKDTGSVHMWKNNGIDASTGKFSFTDSGVVSGSAKCTEGYGIGINDLGVRFASLTGSKRADYLCMTKDGAISGFINNGLNNFQDVGLIKRSTGADRANVRLADINGDGKADYLWVGATTGTVDAITNTKRTPGQSSEFLWQSRGQVSPGHNSRGGTVQFAKIKGTARADYVIVDPITAKQWTYYNMCPGTTVPTPAELPIDPNGPPPAQHETSPGGSKLEDIPGIPPFAELYTDKSCPNIADASIAKDVWNHFHVSKWLTRLNTYYGIDRGMIVLKVNNFTRNQNYMIQGDCTDLTKEGNCDAPFCQSDVTKEEYPFYLISRSFAQYWAYQRTLRNAFLETTFLGSLAVSSIVEDFRDLDKKEDSTLADIIKGFGTALGIGGTLLGGLESSAPGVITGVIGGVLSWAGDSLFSSPDPPSDSNITKELDAKLLTTFEIFADALSNSTKDIFKYGDFSRVVGALTYDHDDPENDEGYSHLGAFFADGKFLVNTLDTDALLANLNKQLRMSLISTRLRMSHVYIVVGAWDGNPAVSTCKDNSGVSIDNICYSLEQPGIGLRNLNPLEDLTRSIASKPVDQKFVDLFTSDFFTLEQVVQSSLGCQRSFGYYGAADFNNINVEPADQFPGATTPLPDCVANLPLFYVDPATESAISSTPCFAYERAAHGWEPVTAGLDYLPDDLVDVFDQGFCEVTCNKVHSCG